MMTTEIITQSSCYIHNVQRVDNYHHTVLQSGLSWHSIKSFRNIFWSFLPFLQQMCVFSQISMINGKHIIL